MQAIITWNVLRLQISSVSMVSPHGLWQMITKINCMICRTSGCEHTTQPFAHILPQHFQKQSAWSIKGQWQLNCACQNGSSNIQCKSNNHGCPPKWKPALPMWHLHFFLAICTTEQNKRGFKTHTRFYGEGFAAAPFSQNLARLVEIKQFVGWLPSGWGVLHTLGWVAIIVRVCP